MGALRDYIVGFASFIEAESGIPTFTDIMPDTTDEKDALVYLDDQGPWVIEPKNQSLNVMVVFRYELDKLSRVTASDIYEIDAQEEVYNLLTKWVQERQPPGQTYRLNATRCYGDDTGRFIIESRLTTTFKASC